MHEPKISVVISVLDGAATLPSCLESVFEQTYRHRDLVVIDGGSSDGTQGILQREGGRIEYWESAADRGICHAWNKALDRVTGEWICFLGADDRFRAADALERAARELGRLDEGLRVAYASVDVVGGDGQTLATVGSPWPEVRESFRQHMAIPHQATFHRRELFALRGKFDESFRICGDYELLLRELLAHDAHFIPGLVVVAMGAGGISDDPASSVTMTHEFVRARRLHGLGNLPVGLSFRLFRARCRHWISAVLGRRAADRAAGAYRALTGRGRR